MRRGRNGAHIKRLAALAAGLAALVLTVPPAGGAAPTAASLTSAAPLEGAIIVDDGVVEHGHAQHGGPDGHLPATSQNVRLVGQLRLSGVGEGRIGDVAVFDDHAYLAAYREPTCANGGVYVVDVSNPKEPEEVTFIPTGPGSYVGEGVQVIKLDTDEFTGELLVFNNEICGTPTAGTVGGLTLVDVSEPDDPEVLATNVGDFSPPSFFAPGLAHTIHSVFIWQAGERAFAVLVDNEENADVDIMEITDPSNPVLIGEFDLDQRYPQILQPDLGSASSFLHDMVVKRIGGRWVMLLSYWDGGYVQLDVTNPANPVYLADTDFTSPDPEALESGLVVPPEGNGHQAEFSRNNQFVVGTDEDFDPYKVIATNTTDGGFFTVIGGSDTAPIAPGSPLIGRTVFVGLACDTGPAVPAAGTGTIAVVERGVCTFTEKVANVEAAGGYAGVIVMNREGADACSDTFGMSVEGGIPAGSVARDVGLGLFNVAYNDAACRDATLTTAPIALGALGDSVNIGVVFDGWGYVHLYRNGTGKLTELDTYAIPEAHDPAFASGFGDLTVHEVAMSQRRNNLAYFSYYSGGFRVARIEGDELVERGRFIAPGGNNFWGVEVFQDGDHEYVAASDRDYGLFIFEYTGP